MRLQDEIVSEFIRTLGTMPEFPPQTLQRLQEMLTQGLHLSVADLRDAIEMGVQSAPQSEEHLNQSTPRDTIS